MGCGCNKGKKAQKATLEGYVTPPNVQPVKENNTEGPGLLKKALSFGEAIVDHVSDGLAKVEKNELAARLTICGKCIHNHNGTCNKCGCVLSTKAGWRSADCPEGYWPNAKEK